MNDSTAQTDAALEGMSSLILFFFFKDFIIYLFIYFCLRRVLVVARGIFRCGAWASL